MNEFIKYIVAGVINTTTGYGIFWIMLRWLKFSPEVANAIGYMIALFVAFLLNRYFVFSGAVFSASSAGKFIVASAFAFSINQLVLFVQCHIFLVPPEIAQIFAMIVYTVIFYLFNKYYVFAAPRQFISDKS